MLDWDHYFTANIKKWLLEDDNPPVKYLTLLYLLDTPENSSEVQAAKRDLMTKDPVNKILSYQSPDGSFYNKKLKIKSKILDPKFGYLPKYKGTIWQAIFLAQLGADKNDIRIKKLCNYILKMNYFDDLEVLGLKFIDGRRGKTTIPCYTSNLVWALSKLGFYNDHRVQKSIEWLIKYQRFDDGSFKTPNDWPYRGRADRCFGKHSCYFGCTQALKAMTMIPEQDITPEIEKFIYKAVEFILLHNVYKRSRKPNTMIRKEYQYLTFPLTYYNDVLEILNSLLFFRIKHKAIDDSVKFLLQKCNSTGTWPLEKTISRSSYYTAFEPVGQESKWSTFRVLSMLKKYMK